jgi:cytochrome P450
MKHFSMQPTDPAFVQDPYLEYDRMRQAGDLVYWTDYDLPCAVSYALVNAVLKDRRMGRAAPPEKAVTFDPALAPFYAVESHSMLELEPPDHTRLRGLVLRAFTSRRIAALGPEITQLCHDLIDRFPGGAFDLIDAFARPLPVIIIARLLGVPEDRADDLLGWSNAMVAMYQARRTPQIAADAVAATLAFSDFLADHIDRKRCVPGDDLISTLIAAEQDGNRLSRDELITTCILLLNAGHEATVHTIGNGVKALLAHGTTTVTPATVEEILRFDPPLHMFTRWIYDDVTLAGHDFRRGDQIACLLGAANRDPAAFANPHLFDPLRQGPANTSFGAGIHFCVGAPLARLELLIALQTLLARCPQLTLAASPTYANLYHFHGLDRLMVQARP